MVDITEVTIQGQLFIQMQNDTYVALVSQYGAQVLEVHKKDFPFGWLWLSEARPIVQGEAIRGGIPICWPVFGVDADGKLPKHGFARLQNWTYKGDFEDDAAQQVAVSFRLRDNEYSKQYWPYAFELELAFMLSADGIRCELTITNTDVRAFEHSFAFHPYFFVGGLSKLKLEGLEQHSYHREGQEEAHIWQAKESLDQFRDDRVMDVHEPVVLKDGLWKRSLEISMQGASDMVVWNPHQEGAKAISDMADDGYKSMLCVEPAQVDKLTLDAGESHLLSMVWQFR
jgi:glucose-6-phosphate 1-epimerase